MNYKKLLLSILCMFTRHNKYTIKEKNEASEEFFDICSVCNKRWKNIELTRITALSKKVMKKEINS